MQGQHQTVQNLDKGHLHPKRSIIKHTAWWATIKEEEDLEQRHKQEEEEEEQQQQQQEQRQQQQQQQQHQEQQEEMEIHNSILEMRQELNDVKCLNQSYHMLYEAKCLEVTLWHL